MSLTIERTQKKGVEEMTSELTIIITDGGESIVRLKYGFASVCPVRGALKLELEDFLALKDKMRGNRDYLNAAHILFIVLNRSEITEKMSEETYRDLHMLYMVYNGLQNEHYRLKRQRLLRERQCDYMLISAYRIVDILKKSSFIMLDSSDYRTMKKYLLSHMPDKSELKEYPQELLNKIRPFFALLKILIELSPEDEDKLFIEYIMHNIYGEK